MRGYMNKQTKEMLDRAFQLSKVTEQKICILTDDIYHSSELWNGLYRLCCDAGCKDRILDMTITWFGNNHRIEIGYFFVDPALYQKFGKKSEILEELRRNDDNLYLQKQGVSVEYAVDYKNEGIETAYDERDLPTVAYIFDECSVVTK